MFGFVLPCSTSCIRSVTTLCLYLHFTIHKTTKMSWSLSHYAYTFLPNVKCNTMLRLRPLYTVCCQSYATSCPCSLLCKQSSSVNFRVCNPKLPIFTEFLLEPLINSNDWLLLYEKNIVTH